MTRPRVTKAVRTDGGNTPAGGKALSPEIILAASSGATSPFTPSRYVITMPAAPWMGPYQPLKPVANAPEQGVRGRQFDFPVGFNLRIQPRQEEATSFAQLRALADNLDLLRLVIEKRKDQVESYEWEVMAKDGTGDTPEEKAQIKRVTEFFMSPSTEHEWTTWLRASLEEIFVLDAWALCPRYLRGGDLFSMDLLDGATVTRKLDVTGRTPTPPDVAYQQVFKGVPAVDYSADELLYTMRNPRAFKIYGYSPVEQILMTVNTAIRKAVWQLSYFTEGNIPEAFGSLPDSWNMEAVQQFQQYWDSIIEGNLGMRRKLKFVPFDATKIKETKTPDLKDMFDEWLARVICFAFSIPPTPFVREGMNRAVAQALAQAAKAEGITPLLTWLKKRFDYIILKYLKCDKVEFRWTLDEEVSPSEQDAMDRDNIKLGLRTIDEIRMERGRDPFGIDEPLYYTATGVIPLKDALAKAKKDIAAASAAGDPGLVPAPKPLPGADGEGKPGDKGGKGDEKPGDKKDGKDQPNISMHFHAGATKVDGTSITVQPAEAPKVEVLNKVDVAAPKVTVEPAQVTIQQGDTVINAELAMPAEGEQTVTKTVISKRQPDGTMESTITEVRK